jgi:hypothetical protein
MYYIALFYFFCAISVDAMMSQRIFHSASRLGRASSYGRMHVHSKNDKKTEYLAIAQDLVNKLNPTPTYCWVKELNNKSFECGKVFAINTSKIRPLNFTMHPIRKLNTLLRLAVQENDMLLCNEILQEDLGVFKTHLLANTLHVAAVKNRTNMLELLIKNGADVDERYGNISSTEYYRDQVKEYPQGEGPTPLLFAAMEGNIDIVRLLIENGADVDKRSSLFLSSHPEFDHYQGVTALHYAADRGDSAIVTLLLNNGAWVDSETGFKETPLALAVFKGHKDIVRILLENGAFPGQVTRAGYIGNFAHDDETFRLIRTAEEQALEFLRKMADRE